MTNALSVQITIIMLMEYATNNALVMQLCKDKNVWIIPNCHNMVIYKYTFRFKLYRIVFYKWNLRIVLGFIIYICGKEF